MRISWSHDPPHMHWCRAKWLEGCVLWNWASPEVSHANCLHITHYFWEVGVLDSSRIYIFLKLYTDADYIFVMCLKVDVYVLESICRCRVYICYVLEGWYICSWKYMQMQTIYLLFAWRLIYMSLKVYSDADYIFVSCLKVDEVWKWGNCWLKHKVRQSLNSCRLQLWIWVIVVVTIVIVKSMVIAVVIVIVVVIVMVIVVES